MYLMFVDESGTHGHDAHAFVLGGLALHENDAAQLQSVLDELVIKHLGRVPVNLEEYELHANEMRNAKKPKGSAQGRTRIWATVPRHTRLTLLEEAYASLATFTPATPEEEPWLFGVVLDRRFRTSSSPLQRERFAYEVLLNKFDVMLKRLRVDDDQPNRGLVIHDRRVVAEADIQSWVTEWRAAAGDVGQLRNLADVPLFTDSRATRLLQAADLVTYALYRRYATTPDTRYFDLLWPRFHRDRDGTIHGLVHYTPSFGQGMCTCEACTARTP
ncbi:Protein of uncharacterised function (DUF3800) [Dermacoccus nishinomiyaensis]|nr:Protein of uncharacterised function (DUF3800) [Dermacoccus nishinomiyaensis]